MSLFTWIFALFTLLPLHAHASDTAAIPKALLPWVDWVLVDKPKYKCPFFYNNHQQKYCAWPSHLNLELENQSGTFSSDWQLYNQSYITLPGSTHHWPQNVTVNNKPALVISRNNHPAIKLDTGHHLIQGSFSWDSIPDNTGIISVTVLNKSILYPTIKNQKLWLKTSDLGITKPEHRTDQLNLQVFRKIYDSTPLQLTTYLSLEVSGKQREITLPYTLFNGFIPISLTSTLPARLEADGSLLVQVRPGRWHIELKTQYPTELKFPNNYLW